MLLRQRMVVKRGGGRTKERQVVKPLGVLLTQVLHDQSVLPLSMLGSQNLVVRVMVVTRTRSLRRMVQLGTRGTGLQPAQRGLFR